MSANHAADRQTLGREGGFRGNIKNPKESEKSCLQQRQKKRKLLTLFFFLSDLEKQADLQSRNGEAASLDAASLEQSFLTLEKGVTKDI